MTAPAEDPRELLEALGQPVKLQGRELVTTCPFCGKAEHFSVNAQSGLWQCWVCSEKGNLWQLRQRLGLTNGHQGRPRIEPLSAALGAEKRRIPPDHVEKMHAALLADEEALAYVKARAWSLDVVKRMKLGLRVDTRGKWLGYPWLRRGNCLGMKFRILPAYEKNYPQRFDREPGCESILFNVDALEHHEEIILASGESDLLTLLTLGFENAVATTTGESSLPASAVDALAKKPRVLVPFDNDRTGQEGIRKVAKRLGFDRIYLVRLPAEIHDVAEFVIQGGTRQQFEALLAAATRFDVPTVLTIGQALDRLEAEKTIGTWDGVDEMTPWPSVNRRIGRWRGGNLIVVSAPQGTGKTTWSLNVCVSWAQQGFPALFYCLEMGVEELIQHVLCMHYQLSEEQITPEVLAKARRDLADWPLYLGSNPRATGRQELMELLGQAVRRYGLHMLAFDNLHMLARSIEHRTEEVGVLTKGFKLFAMEHEIPLVLIAQPRKLGPHKVMTPWDLKDSVDIYSDADQIILLHRELVASVRDREAVTSAGDGETDTLSSITLVRVAKARHRRSSDGLLYFVGAEHRFRELEAGDLLAARPPGRSESGRHPGYRDD